MRDETADAYIEAIERILAEESAEYVLKSSKLLRRKFLILDFGRERYLCSLGPWFVSARNTRWPRSVFLKLRISGSRKQKIQSLMQFLAQVTLYERGASG